MNILQRVLLLAAITVAFDSASAPVCFAQRDRPRVPTPREIAQRSFSSVVVLVTADKNGKVTSLGSGFFIRENLIATNYHVVNGASRVYAKLVGQRRIYEVAEIVSSNEAEDLALLRLQGAKVRPLPLGNSRTVAVGDTVYVVGNPEGLEGTFSQGIVSSLRGKGLFQITAAISHGSSGGPVLDQRGQVIGVAVGSREEGQNLNFAVSVSSLAAEITRASRTVSAIVAPGNDLEAGPVPISHPRTTRRSKVPDSAKAYYDQGIEFWLHRRFDEAVAAYRRAIRIKPNYFEAYSSLCFVLYLQGQTQEGIQACKQAIRINPDYFEAYSNLGFAYHLLNQSANAVEAYKQAIRITPDDTKVHHRLAEAYLDLKRYPDAIKECKLVIRLEPEYPDSWVVYYVLGQAYEGLAQPVDALGAYKQSIGANPFSESYYRLGTVYFDLYRYKEAADSYKQAIRLQPDHSSAHFNLGLAYLNLGERGLALEQYKVLKTIDELGALELFNLINASPSSRSPLP